MENMEILKILDCGDFLPAMSGKEREAYELCLMAGGRLCCAEDHRLRWSSILMERETRLNKRFQAAVAMSKPKKISYAKS